MRDENGDRTGYWQRVINGARMGVTGAIARATDQERWVDDEGKIHWRRKLSYPTLPPIVSPPPTPPPPPPVVSGRVFARLLHDYELLGVSRVEWLIMSGAQGYANTRGLPETIKALDSKFVALPRAWQFYWFDLLKKRMSMQGEIPAVDPIATFQTVTRKNAFKTNNHAAENGFANFPIGANLTAAPMASEVIWTGGALVELLDYPTKYKLGGHDTFKVKTLDVHDDPPSVDAWDGLFQTPTIYFATTSRRRVMPDGTIEEMPDHTPRVIPLLGSFDIAVPAISFRPYAFIAAERIQIVSYDPVAGVSGPSPYNR